MWHVFFLLRAFYRFISCFCCPLVFKSLIFIVFPFVLFVRLFVSHCYRCLFCVCQCLFPFKTVWYAAFNVYLWLVPVYVFDHRYQPYFVYVRQSRYSSRLQSAV